MSAPTVRTRVLLLALGVTAILGLLYWPEAEEQSWAPNRNYVRDDSRPTAATVTTATPTARPEDEQVPPRSPILSDSELVHRVAGYGLMTMEREHGAHDAGSFYFVDLMDSTRSLRSLGFIQASALLDSAARFVALTDSAPASRLAVAAMSPVDSALRARIEDCIFEVPVPVRDAAGGEARWRLALMPGVEPALPAGEWGASRATATDRQETLRLARQLRAGPVETADGFLLDSTRVPEPPEIKSVHRFTRDGIDFLVADVRVEHRRRGEDKSGGDRVYEQRLFIAERDARDRAAPFRVVWSREDAAHGDETSTEEPVMMLRLGADRLLTLYTSGDYKDGGGGLFISRVGKGDWRIVARWYAGC